jgi:predicted RNA-binding protein with RPS1 domain
MIMDQNLNTTPGKIEDIKKRWLRIGQYDAGRSLMDFKNDIEHASQLAKWYVQDIHTLLKVIENANKVSV